MKNKMKELEQKMQEQQEQIRLMNKQLKRQKWMNVYLLWSR